MVDLHLCSWIFQLSGRDNYSICKVIVLLWHLYSVLEVFFIYGTLNLTFLHYITLSAVIQI